MVSALPLKLWRSSGIFIVRLAGFVSSFKGCYAKSHACTSGSNVGFILNNILKGKLQIWKFLYLEVAIKLSKHKVSADP